MLFDKRSAVGRRVIRANEVAYNTVLQPAGLVRSDFLKEEPGGDVDNS